MARNISDLLREADDIIEKRASQKPAAISAGEEDVFKLAEALRGSIREEVQAPAEWTLQEKLAHALMLVGTFANLPELTKMAQFEKKASAAGYEADEINACLEKRASFDTLTSISDLIPWLED